MASTDIFIRVRLGAGQFRSFCAFDTFRIKRRHLPALIVTVILLTLGVAALLFGNSSSGTLAGILTGLALAVPMVLTGLYVIQIESQVSAQGLKASPEVYALRLGENGVTITGVHRSSGSAHLDWNSVWAAYRVRGAIYLYVSEERAFILPDGQANEDSARIWDFLRTQMGDSRCFSFVK